MPASQDRYLRFAELYLAHGTDTYLNIFRSAVGAGYSKNFARRNPKQLMASKGVQKALELRRKELRDLSRVKDTIAAPQEILENLTRDLRFNPKSCVTEDGRFKGLHEMSDEAAMSLKKIKIKEKILLGDKDKEVKVLDRDIEYWWQDKVNVAKTLGEMLGMKNGDRDKMKELLNLVLNVQVNNKNTVTPELMAEAIKGAAKLIAKDERGLIGQMRSVTPNAVDSAAD